MSLLEVRNLGVQFRTENRLVEAVQDISFNIDRGETLALVGESGSGKSVTALSILQLLPYPRARHPHGSIQFNNMEMLGASKTQLHEVRGNKISMIFQEPTTFLNPVLTVGKQISESLILHLKINASSAKEETIKLLKACKLDWDKNCLEFYKNKRAIKTASVVQVRKPIYKNSMNSWKNYKDKEIAMARSADAVIAITKDESNKGKINPIFFILNY